ncbi:MAG: tryptophan--tRNA ligase [Oscillospiraceae bacterium]|nr:tryptophan--tRNA ligase [Oscillospiraceae bacterium]
MEHTPAPEKKLIQFSGIKPTGSLTLGSYLGAIKNWTELCEEYESFFCVVDMHSITIRVDPALLRRNAMEQLAYYIACGLDPEACTLFIQSHVPAHAELSWVLGCYTMFGELSRMTQFKEKSAKNADNINGGLFTYPVLMAADILLYDTDVVPVGEDQRQHVELCRDIANRFNGVYGETFKLPRAILPKVGARIMSLTEPDHKMSKSDDRDPGSVLLKDPDDVIMRKFKRAVTDCDSERCVRYDPENKKGVANLMSIYAAVTGKSFSEIEREFDGKGYGVFKPAVGEAVCGVLRPIREEAGRLLADRTYLDSVCAAGAEKAERASRRILSKVYKKVGFLPRPR